MWLHIQVKVLGLLTHFATNTAPHEKITKLRYCSSEGGCIIRNCGLGITNVTFKPWQLTSDSTKLRMALILSAHISSCCILLSQLWNINEIFWRGGYMALDCWKTRLGTSGCISISLQKAYCCVRSCACKLYCTILLVLKCLLLTAVRSSGYDPHFILLVY